MHAAQEEEQNLTSVQSMYVYMNEWEKREKKVRSDLLEMSRKWRDLKKKKLFSLLFQDEYRKDYISEEES